MLKNTLIKKVELNAMRRRQGYDEYNFPINDFEQFVLKECTVQPLKSSEQSVLPEGYRTRKAYKIFTSTEVITAEEGSEKLSDQIWIFGEWYDVVVVNKWANGIQPHYEALAVRQELREAE